MEAHSRDRQFLNKNPATIQPYTSLLTPISYHLNHASDSKLAPKENYSKISQLNSGRKIGLNIGGVAH